jgi:hypothetical protein
MMLITTVLSTAILLFGSSANASPAAEPELQKRDAGVRYRFRDDFQELTSS